MKYTEYTLIDWPIAQELIKTSWFAHDAVPKDPFSSVNRHFFVPTKLLKEYYNCQSDTEAYNKNNKSIKIIWHAPEILLDSQIQPAIDKLNDFNPEVKATLIQKDSMFKRDLKIEITGKITEDDIFCLGMIFDRAIKL